MQQPDKLTVVVAHRAPFLSAGSPALSPELTRRQSSAVTISMISKGVAYVHLLQSGN
jgi:hypothetical protein